MIKKILMWIGIIFMVLKVKLLSTGNSRIAGTPMLANCTIQ